ncbi:12737_t:CDS:2 [Rhizophagus irregularis]|nr:12737_t:CDS:2 [Rhizophagus irregularis]
MGSSDSYNQFLLQQEIYSLMIKKSKACLESLCELKCDTSIDSIHFYGLARICKSIQRLIIINKCLEVNFGIVKLIKIQENLKYFEWRDDFETEEFLGDPYEEILLALEKKADVLNHLIMSFNFIEVYEHTTLQDVLTKLHKLKTLIITGNFHIISSRNQLNKMVYRELEIFNIDFISLGKASNIIENSGGHIKEIPLSYEYYEYGCDDIEEESLIFIRKIYENCPLIENLSLLCLSSDEHLTELEKLLKDCKYLKSLSLIIIDLDRLTTDEEIGKELLKILIRSTPNNLRKIKFYGNSQFPLKSLEEFLEKWRGLNALSLYTTGDIYKSNDYMKLIKKYKNKGVIKDFIS